MKTIVLTLVASILLGTLLSACGQKGALYLPEKPTTAPTQTAEPEISINPNDY